MTQLPEVFNYFSETVIKARKNRWKSVVIVCFYPGHQQTDKLSSNPIVLIFLSHQNTCWIEQMQEKCWTLNVIFTFPNSCLSEKKGLGNHSFTDFMLQKFTLLLILVESIVSSWNCDVASSIKCQAWKWSICTLSSWYNRDSTFRELDSVFFPMVYLFNYARHADLGWIETVRSNGYLHTIQTFSSEKSIDEKAGK